MQNISDINYISIFLIAIFVIPIFEGFMRRFSSKDIKNDISSLNRSLSAIISLFLGVLYAKKIISEYQLSIYSFINTLPDVIKHILENDYVVLILIILIMTSLINLLLRSIIELISQLAIYPIFDGLEGILNTTNNVVKSIFGALFQLPKAICRLLVSVLILNILSMMFFTTDFNNYLKESMVYSDISQKYVVPITNSDIARKLPQILNNSMKVVIKQNNIPANSNLENDINIGKTTVYYNGVTLDQGVKSNNSINEFAVKITKSGSNNLEKSKIIYEWTGENIKYDYSKADKILSNDFSLQSGAIPTFNTRKGICFDYACLYVAMCRAVKLKVRLVTGQGFNGYEWVNHSWNQVYDSNSGKWINVDCTFYKVGNYFDNKTFYFDHRNGKIIGEW